MSSNPENVLLTGAGGFIGSHLLRRLERNGVNVLSVVRNSDCTYHDAIVTDLSLKPLPKSVDCAHVVHCASVLPSSDITDFEVNVSLTENLLAGLPATVQSFVLTSSVSVYHAPPADMAWRLDESAAVTTEGYGGSKLRQEQLVQDWCRENGCRLTIFRLSSVFGVNGPQTLLFRICEAAIRNEEINLHAPTGYRQNFLPVDDVCHLIESALCGSVSGTYNLFSNTSLSARELAEVVVAELGSSSRIVDRPTADAVPTPAFCNEKLRADFQPEFTDFRQAIRELADGITQA